jgi:patatin-like phospholipase/acyl hydrolase
MFVFIGVMALLSIITASKSNTMGCLLMLGTLAVSCYLLGDQLVDAVHVNNPNQNASENATVEEKAGKSSKSDGHQRQRTKIREQKTDVRH